MSRGERDPPRLLDEGGSEGELRALMRAGKSEVPNEAQMLALAAKIGILGGLGGAGAAGAGGAGGAAGATAKVGLAVKVITALALIGVTGGGVALVAKRSSERAETPVGIVAVATSSATALESPSAPSASTAASTTASTTASVAPPVTAPRPVESPEAEVKLLARAQDALRGRPDEALALCAAHAKRFPSGALVQEREVIAIDALVKLGRTDEARTRADRFKARFPGSTHTRRIETLLAN